MDSEKDWMLDAVRQEADDPGRVHAPARCRSQEIVTCKNHANCI
jgi:hypothetical protein